MLAAFLLSNICAVEEARIRAAVNMDGLLWGVWTEGTGLEKYPAKFQERARALQTPILRLCSEQMAQARFESEAHDFGGDFIGVTLEGWSHGDFATTPWMCGVAHNFERGLALSPPSHQRIELLTGLLSEFSTFI